MNDDWRLQIDAQDEGQGESLVERLDPEELEDELDDAFHDRLIVSREGSTVFVYAGTRTQAENAGAFIDKLAAKHGWSVSTELRHWHPAAAEWEAPDVPLPEDDAARVAEHEERIAAERQKVAESGVPDFEVRVDLPSHHDAVRFAELLEAEGLPAVRRWKYLVVGATDEDAAKDLATRLEGEAPAGSRVTVEGSGAVAYAERPANPFAVFGGLGG
jgi:hypothetical protein